jgi:hypothetical protein
VKRYLTESLPTIPLHDLVSKEAERVYKELVSEKFNMIGQAITRGNFHKWRLQYEAVVERLMAMLAALSHHDIGENSRLLTYCIERLGQVPLREGLVVLLNELRFYPVLLSRCNKVF